MGHPNNRSEYQRRYRTYEYTSSDGANTNGIDADFSDAGQVTAVRIHGNEQIDYRLTVEETDTGNSVEEVTLAGQSVYEVGSYTLPVVEFGADSTIKLENLDDTTGINGVTVIVDERTG